MSNPSTNTKEQFWRNHFAAWETSGLTQVDYCKQNDLKLANFTYWRTRSNKKRSKFIALSAPAVAERLVLDLPYGIRLEIPAQALADVLPTVLRSLQEAG